MKKYLKSIAILTAIIVSGVALTVSANAIDRATLRRFAENNIYFYSPDGVNNSCSSTSSGKTDLIGITPSPQSGSSIENAKKILSRLINAGYSPIAAAAIAGNLDREAGFYPCKVENGSWDGDGAKYSSGVSCDMVERGITQHGNGYILQLYKEGGNAGFGIVQWTTEGRKQGLITEASKNNTRVTDLDTQVDFLVKELTSWRSDEATGHRSSVEILNDVANNTDGLILATWRIYRWYETPGTSFRWKGGTGSSHGDENNLEPTDPLNLNPTDHAGAYNEFYTRRLPSALYFLNLLESSGSVDLTPGDSQSKRPISDSDITIVADDTTSSAVSEALNGKFPGAETAGDLSKVNKYIIYAIDIYGDSIKSKVEEIAKQVASEKTIFFVSDKISVINAVSEVAKDKENVKIVSYTTGEEAKLADYTYDAISAVANAKSRSIDPCVGGTVEGITYKEIDGTLYAFPLAGATKKNYIRSALSGFCSLSAEDLQRYHFADASGGTAYGWCGTHHDYPAVDLGRKLTEESTDSIGAPVVAIASGTLTGYDHYGAVKGTEKWNSCSHATIVTEDGTKFWIGHMKYDSSKESLVGTQVEAGKTVIGEVGEGMCGVWEEGGWTTPHVHVDERCDRLNGTISGDKQWYTTSEQYLCMPHHPLNPDSYLVSTHLNYLMTQLFEELPEE